MSTWARSARLPVAAVALVAGVLAAQLANGGGSYEPLMPPEACTERVVTSRADGIDGLTERLSLLGATDAACALGVTREGLTLELAQSQESTDAEVEALREGLLDAVRQLQDEGTLPPVSELVDEALDNADLNGILEFAIRAIPDSAIDSTLKTDDVLTRAITELDIRALLENLDDNGELSSQIQDAVTEAVKDSLIERVRDIL